MESCSLQLLVAGTLLLAFCSDKEKKICLIKVSSTCRDVVRYIMAICITEHRIFLGFDIQYEVSTANNCD